VLKPGSMEVILLAATSDRRELTERWIKDIIKIEPASLGQWAAGKVCQVCGEIATVSRWEEWVAAHSQGGEFAGFRKNHEMCTAAVTGSFSHGASRFCELCQDQLSPVAERRFWLSWLCEPCETRIRKSGHALELFLDALEKLRFAHYESDPVGPSEERTDDFEWLEREVIAPPVGWLPPGLYRCEECGEIRGTTWGPCEDGSVVHSKSTCICEGIVCRQCGQGRLHRPISDLYHLEDSHFWHFPYFTAAGGCDRCRNPS
jgi:hypothetical protein